MAVVIASNLRKELAGTLLFDGVSFSVERRDRVALSGPNGAGKTTLLRILSGETEKHGGELAFEKGTRVALHDQRPPLERDVTLREYVLSGARDLVALEQELASLEQAMAGGAHDQATLNRYSAAQGRLEHAGGYGWRDHATQVVRGLGFADEQLDRQLRTFSGGELTRASLARALGGDPDLLLLDEPTNHLDVASLEWLERELQSLDAAVILVAHDRWFLEAVTTATLEIVAGRATFFPGPWHAWRREKAARMVHAQKQADRVQDDIVRLERFVERFRAKKEKAKQAQAKLTQIERLKKERADATDEVALLSRRRRTLGFEFLKPARSGRTVIEVDGLTVRIGERELIRDASFALERGEHVALVGPNGSGKTTLLETLLGRREAAAGKIQLGHGVDAGVLLAAGGGARHARHGAAVRADDDGAEPAGRAIAARPLPLLRLGRAREAGGGAVRRRAAAARARGDGRVGRELPRAGRADEPSRPGQPRSARGGAGGVPGDAAARVARPRPARRHRRANAGDRGRRAARVRRRVGGDAAPARGADGESVSAETGEAGEAEARCSEALFRSRARSGPASSRASSPRSPRRRRRWRSSRRSSPRTGPTSTPSPRTSARATPSPRSWSAGRCSSSDPRRRAKSRANV